MMAHKFRQISKALNRLRGDDETPVVAPDPDYHRSTSPDARMNLLLRFDTALGPRTVIASGIPLPLASEITATMIRNGQYAEFTDQCQLMSISERIKRKKAEKPKGKPNNVVGWDGGAKMVLKGGLHADRQLAQALS